MASKKLPGISGRPVTVQMGENVTISRTARFGKEVILGNNVRIGPNCQVGARSRLDNVSMSASATVGEGSTLIDCSLGVRVRIGPRAWCKEGAIDDNAMIGEGFRLYGRGREHTIVYRVIIGDDVRLDGPMKISGRGRARPTVIGDGTSISAADREPISIGDYVAIGKGCLIRDTSIDLSAAIGDDVCLRQASIGYYTEIGSGTTATRARIGKEVEIGQRVIVRPTVIIPDHWLIPDDAIVNPNMASPALPLVIVRTHVPPLS